MKTRPPLLVHLLAHPDSPEAWKLAEAVQARFSGPTASGSLRVPVLLTPRGRDSLPPTDADLDLEAADHVLVVLLADGIMNRTIQGGTGAAWRDFAGWMVTKIPLGEKPHLFLPVALDKYGFDLLPKNHIERCLQLPKEEDDSGQYQLETLLFHIAARAYQILNKGQVAAIAPHEYKAPLRLFLSHAKMDLTSGCSDPVHACKSGTGLQIDGWFDSERMTGGQPFPPGLEAGVRGCDLLVAFYTDHYESRLWCRREILTAKQHGVPILIVNLLKDRENRHFPYAGNAAVVCWDRSQPVQREARKVLAAVALEALRVEHNKKWLKGEAEQGEMILGQAPEAATFARLGGDYKGFLYPDPPLDGAEKDLLKRLRPDNAFRTPLERLRRKKPEGNPMVAVSLAQSDDADHYGLNRSLFHGLCDEIHLYLLMAGYRIGYGGLLRGAFKEADGFTRRLRDLAAGHFHRLLELLEEETEFGPERKPIQNYAPWPGCEGYTEDDLSIFDGREMNLIECPIPQGFSFNTLFPNETVFSDAPTPEQRAAWAAGLTAMRRKMTEDCCARIVMGGRLEGFQGLVPGVVEEAWLSLKAGKPLYLLGGFGGAARALCDLVLGKARSEFETGWNEGRVNGYAMARAALEKAEDVPDLAKMGNDFRELDLSKLNNGLTEEENRILMTSSDARVLGDLLLNGLRAVGSIG